MALAELQAALDRLSTDPAARALFLGDPQAFAREAALTPGDLAALRETAEVSLRPFAHSSLHKRADEVGRTMPHTHAALGEDFGTTFEAFAASVPSARETALDALNFLAWVQRHAPELREPARYDSAWISMRHTGLRFRIGLYTLPRRFLAIWWRPSSSKPSHYFQWPAFPVSLSPPTGQATN